MHVVSAVSILSHIYVRIMRNIVVYVCYSTLPVSYITPTLYNTHEKSACSVPESAVSNLSHIMYVYIMRNNIVVYVYLCYT